MAADGTTRRRTSGVEMLLREILAGQAGFDARLDDVSERLSTTQADARQARDLGNRVAVILEEQNIIARFDAHKTDVRQQMAEIRQDFVAAYTKLRTDLEGVATTAAGERAKIEATAAAERGKLEDRIKALEADLQRREGVKSLAAWLMKNAPWLFAGIAAFAAGVGLQDKIK